MTEHSSKVLLVEDDDSFRDILATLMRRVGHEVDVAQDGKIATNILAIHDYDLVISDIKMPNLDGIELLKWVKAEKDIPVVLMTGFSEILETQSAISLGADYFLPKPFKEEDLEKAVEHCQKIKEKKKSEEQLASQEPEEEGSADSLYCKISIDDFIAGRKMPFSIYVKLPNEKFVKIAYGGEDLSVDRIRKYKDKGMKHLYMLFSDFQLYLEMNLKIARVIPKAKILKAKKLSFIKHAGEVIQEKLYTAEVDKDSFFEAKDFLSNALKVVSEDEDIFNLLDILKQHSDYLYAHSLAVSLYSVILAKKSQWHSIPNRYRIALAGFFHDIGKKEIDREILDKPRPQLSREERALIETHSIRSQEIVNQIKSLPPDLPQIVYQHHEDCHGYGYPLKLKKEQIHPIARLIAVVDTFCNYFLPSPHSPGMTGKEAVEQIMRFDRERLDRTFLLLLAKTFHYEMKDVD